MGILYLLLFVTVITLALAGIPSLLNFLLSWLFCKKIKNQYEIRNKFVLVIVFTIISILLTLNIRLPGLINDTFHAVINPTIEDIYAPLNIPIGSEVALIGDTTAVSFKKSYYESIEVRSVSGIGSDYRFTKPRVKKDDIAKWLTDQGFIIKRNDGNYLRYKIYLKVNSDIYHDVVEMTLYKNEKQHAKYKKRFRKSFILERNDDLYSKIFLYLSQSTITNYLFPDMLGVKGKKYPNLASKKMQLPVSEFLSKVIIAVPAEISVKSKYLKVISETPTIREAQQNQEYKKPHSRIDGWCNKKVFFKPKMINKFTSDLQFYGQEGKRQGTWLILNDKDGENNRVYIRTDEIKKYIFTHEHLVKCSDESVSVLLSFSRIDKSMAEVNKAYNRKFSSREERFEYFKIVQKEVYEEYRTFWWLTYTWDGELLSSKKFTLSSEATYYDTGLNVINKFFKVYQPIEFYKINVNEYRLELMDEGKGYRVIISEDEDPARAHAFD